MDFRRWRRVWTVVLLASALTPALAYAAPTADDFEKAEAKTLPGMVQDVLKSLPPSGSVSARNSAAIPVVKDFIQPKRGINSDRTEVRLNSAVLISSIETLSSDIGLKAMLKSTDPAVRYHGARGLGRPSIADLEKRTGGAPDVVKQLAAAAAGEKSGIVMQEIIRSLQAYEAPAELIHALQAVGAQMQSSMPELSMLQTAADGLNAAAGSVATLAAAEKTQAATAAANLASYSFQQLKAYDKALKDTGGAPKEMFDAVERVVEAAGKVAGAASGKTFNVKSSSLEELELNVTSTFGAPGGNPGALQKAIPDVKVPAAITSSQ